MRKARSTEPALLLGKKINLSSFCAADRNATIRFYELRSKRIVDNDLARICI